MNFLLDTNILSEVTKAEPNVKILDWLQARREDTIYLSVVTIAEIQHGIHRLPESRKKEQLADWLHNNVLVNYANFIIPLDITIMLEWGELTGKLKNRGRSLPIMDSLIAATTKKYNLTLVTRNVADFVDTEILFINPLG